MRPPLVAILLLLSISGLFLGLLPPRGRVDSPLERAVPDSALAVVVINQPSEDYDLPTKIDLGEWITGNPATVLEKIPAPVRDQLGSLLREDLGEAWIILQRLEPRDNGAWRIHFTALLQPKDQRLEAVRRRIQDTMAAAFGPEMKMAEEGPIRVFKGSQPGQELFQVRLPGFLVVSNSAEARDESLKSWFGKAPRLDRQPGYRRVKAHLRVNRGVFLYCDCSRVLPILPEFGYQIERRGDDVKTRSFVVAAE